MTGLHSLNAQGTGLVGSIAVLSGSQYDKPRLEDGTPSESVSKDSPSFEEETRETPMFPRNKVKTILILFAIYMAIFLAALDTVILPTALPSIIVALKASDSGFAWIGATHMISGAASVAFWSKIGDIFGRKSVLMAAKAAYVVGSMISALCRGIGLLFLGRVIQGMGGAGIIILANRVIDDLFNHSGRVLYLAVAGVIWSIAIAVGPVIGGTFAEVVGWRWCFWSVFLLRWYLREADVDLAAVNLPCIGMSFLLLSVLLKAHHPRTPLLVGLKAIDWQGTITIIASTILLLLGFEFGGVQFPWESATVICLIVSGILTFFIFLFLEWKVAKQPLFPLAIFKRRSIGAAFTICVTHGMVFQSHQYLMPCYFQAVLGASPSQSGLWSLTMTGIMAATNVGVGFHIKRRGHYSFISRIGAALLTLGLGLFINFPPYPSWARIILFQAIVALGMGMLFQPPLIALQKHLSQDYIGMGTSAFLFLRPLSYGISAVVGQLLLQSQMKTKYPEMVNADIPFSIARTLTKEDTVKGTPLIIELSVEQQVVVRSAITSGLEKLWIFYTSVSFVGLVASFYLTEAE